MSEQKHTPEECEPSPLGLPMRPILIRNDEMELLGASTPGPWKTDEEEYSQYVFGPDGEMICEMRGWGYLTGNRRKLSEKEAVEIQAANCKLIARAPELLQQVAELTKENERLRERIDTDWYVVEQNKELSRLREERKELVEAMRERINMLNPSDDWSKFEYNFLQNLLSKQSILDKFNDSKT